MGQPFTMNFTMHDISKYDKLYHVTLKENCEGIRANGLRIYS